MGVVAAPKRVRPAQVVVRVVLVLVALVIAYLVVTAVQVWWTGRRYDPRPAGAIVVMGAAQYDGVPSPDLAARLNEAELLWRQHEASTIMVTGSKQPGDLYTEAEASARYLVDAGVPEQDIDQSGGSDSWENLSLAAPVLLARGEGSVLIVTDPFHEARSLAIASSVGLSPSPTPTRTSPIRGMASVPYYAKETVGVALGRIIGFNRLDALHTPFGSAGA